MNYHGFDEVSRGIYTGVSTFTRNSIRRFEMRFPQDKIISPKELRERCEFIRQVSHRTGNELVLTSGCFDLLHGGHLEYLCDAKKLGVLIVGVNSDAFVRRLKGPSRPIRPEADRAFLIAGFEPVDFATVFDDDVELILAVRPDVYIASVTSNVRVFDDQPRIEALQEVGASIVELEAKKEESTTSIIGRARNALA